MPKRVSKEILTGFEDALGNRRNAPQETVDAIEAAIGSAVPEARRAVMVIGPGERRPLRGPAQITLEDGAVLSVANTLPADLPAGYHTLHWRNEGQPTKLIVSPGLCHLPEQLRIWGWSAQLYALRSRRSWGIGDLADLRQLGHWAARQLDAGILLVNPLGASLPMVPQRSSPYFPSSRRYRNPLYLRIEEVPNAAAAATDIERLAALARELNSRQQIDRDAVFKLKRDALELLWPRFSGDPRFDRYCREQGAALTEFATFCALVEHHGAGWRKWPAEYRKPGAPSVARYAEQHTERVRFHQWMQWLLDEQLARAAAEIPLMQDLPIGVDPDGADAWAWQDVLAECVTVGSPPDEYNTRGQDWGLPPFVPWKLRAASYEPLIQTLRAALRHAGGLRIDHVMGWFRLFWIPRQAEPAAGAYVRYPADELLAILALESQRAKACVVGEDLGTVDENARKELARRQILSYRLLWFEKEPPAHFPKKALAAVTTHDLPTIAGLWTGADLEAQRQLGLRPNEDGTMAIRERLRSLSGLSDDAQVAEAITGAYALLAQAPSMIVTATLEDLLSVEERPNMPGAPDRSWSLALPQPLEQLQSHPLANTISSSLRQGRRRSSD